MLSVLFLLIFLTNVEKTRVERNQNCGIVKIIVQLGILNDHNYTLIRVTVGVILVLRHGLEKSQASFLAILHVSR